MSPEKPVNRRTQKDRWFGEPITKRLFSLKDSAVYLGRTVWGVRELVWNGRLPVIREGRKYYIDIKDLDAYIENNKTVMY